MKVYNSILWILLTLIVGCQAKSPVKNEPLKVYLLLSVDWEGDTLREKNLEAMREFNKKFPQYPIIHFINPAYYTKKEFNLSEDQITDKIRSVIRPQDELGLHIHAWENLVKSAKVTYRNKPSFWGGSSKKQGGERGSDIPLTIYNEDEVSQIIAHSLEILEQKGFSQIQSFRAGGWMSNLEVQKALIDNGINTDSSPVPPSLISKLYPGSELVKTLHKLWGSVETSTRPWVSKLKGNVMYYFPDNFALADYVDEALFFRQFLDLERQALESNENSLYIHYGWHQESAVEYFKPTGTDSQKLVQAHYLRRVERSIKRLRSYCEKQGYKLIPTTMKRYSEEVIK
jgi:hypothetical protein